MFGTECTYLSLTMKCFLSTIVLMAGSLGKFLVSYTGEPLPVGENASDTVALVLVPRALEQVVGHRLVAQVAATPC